MILSESSHGRIFILIDRRMLNGLQDRVRVTLRRPQVLQDGRYVIRPTGAKACRNVLLI